MLLYYSPFTSLSREVDVGLYFWQMFIYMYLLHVKPYSIVNILALRITDIEFS